MKLKNMTMLVGTILLGSSMSCYSAKFDITNDYELKDNYCVKAIRFSLEVNNDAVNENNFNFSESILVKGGQTEPVPIDEDNGKKLANALKYLKPNQSLGFNVTLEVGYFIEGAGVTELNCLHTLNYDDKVKYGDKVHTTFSMKKGKDEVVVLPLPYCEVTVK